MDELYAVYLIDYDRVLYDLDYDQLQDYLIEYNSYAVVNDHKD